jgi:leucyl aminopeptidase
MITLKASKAVPARSSVVVRLLPTESLQSSGVPAAVLKRLTFSGGAGEVIATHTDAVEWLTLVGVGESESLMLDGIRAAAARAVRSVSAHTSAVLDLGPVLAHVGERLGTDRISQAAAEGALLGSYRFDRYKAADDKPVLTTLTIAGATRSGLTRGEIISDAVCFARDLVNEPGGVLTPAEFATRAKQRGTAAGLTVKVLGAKEIAKARLGGLLSVSRGSDQEPKFVTMTYTPPKATRSVALVGKGITFDSGGLSIKPADAMMTMKCDMGGAAAVIATMCALPALGCKVAVTSYTPMTDNMLGGDATRPGDVMTARNGKTVEILNTDAEGRLVLADALSLASESSPDAIVDLATLTGACMVALGDKFAGLMSNNEELAGELLGAAAGSGESFWRLPLPPEYRKLLDSPIADLKNIGGRYGGALTAGLFLQEFVGEGISWAHLDIAGPAFSEESEAEIHKGGTGFGVRTLLEWLI